MRIADLTKDEYLSLDRKRVVPTVPLGSIEQHGPHLPMGTDTFQCEAIVTRAETLVAAVMLVTPPLWVGNSVNHLGLGAALTLDPTRYVSVLADLGRSFLDGGFKHLLFVNGHGANSGPLQTALHQLEYEFTRQRDDVQIAATSWWVLAPDLIEEVRESPRGEVGHACEIETSLMLAAQPALVHEDRYVRGIAHPHPDWASYDLVDAGRVTLVEMFHRHAPAGTIGRPDLATREKGERLVDGIARRLADFVREFSTW